MSRFRKRRHRPPEQPHFLTQRPARTCLAGIRNFSLGEAYIAEAEAILATNSDRSRTAAERYRELEMPYEEARCRINVGELDRARDLLETFGLGDGPLGGALAHADASQA